ncbi:MAG: KamA family radical SAM protein [Candidatus Cloacimonadota bacterium]|nr:MAG: KamA family radical SAM protein [Candidatus Cloacimonadota bacterium]
MWRKELKTNIRTIDELKKYIRLTKLEENQFKNIVKYHPMNITKHYLSLIDFEDPDDPLKKMVIPSLEEMNLSGSYDTSDEKSSTILSGLQHKYPQTALILATNICASYCRFCFRKRLVGLSSREVVKNFEHATDYIKQHEEINNVLITGGDPLMLRTEVIRGFLEELENIEHLNFIRFGTKVPVFLPNRILKDDELLKLFRNYNKQIYLVMQIDHPKEITSELKRAVKKLLRTGVIINNQTVLLKGVNDKPEILANLQSKLISIGINPYYVFQCRPVKRVKRSFQLSLFKGLKIVEEAKTMMSGHGKRFKYIMSHKTGKIEIIGILDDEIYFKYHQAKDPKNYGKFFKRKLIKSAGWLDELH